MVTERYGNFGLTAQGRSSSPPRPQHLLTLRAEPPPVNARPVPQVRARNPAGRSGRDPETGARLVNRAVEHFGRVDTLVNNAGVFLAKPFTDYTDTDFDMVTGVNLRGFFSVTRQAIAAMLRNSGTRRGHVVNISTSLVDHANTAVPSALASLTKGGLNAVTRSLAIEYAACGVRVNTVSPGVIRTPMHAEETYDTLAALHPVGRMGDVGDIVEAITYLETAEFVTGEILHVDGGQSAGH